VSLHGLPVLTPCCVVRLCWIAPGQACAGATPEERSRWRLGAPQDYAFLSSQVYQLKGANDAEDYRWGSMPDAGDAAHTRECWVQRYAAPGLGGGCCASWWVLCRVLHRSGLGTMYFTVQP
jgi:hypothetical protein